MKIQALFVDQKVHPENIKKYFSELEKFNLDSTEEKALEKKVLHQLDEITELLTFMDKIICNPKECSEFIKIINDISEWFLKAFRVLKERTWLKELPEEPKFNLLNDLVLIPEFSKTINLKIKIAQGFNQENCQSLFDECKKWLSVIKKPLENAKHFIAEQLKLI